MKKLSLKKETLSELTDDQLRSIAGGADIYIGGVSGTCYTCVGYTCAGCHVSQGCPSDDTRCPSVDGCTDSCTYRDLCDRTVVIGA